METTSARKTKVGILYIVTGRYVVLWPEFIESLREKFLPDCEKHVYLFSDQDDFFTPAPDITYIHMEHRPWPYSTLLRYHTFLEHVDKWQDCDYMFYLNADYIFWKTVTRDMIFPGPEGGIISVLVPKCVDAAPDEFPYERSPESRACIPFGQGKYYYAGGFNGGPAKDFLAMSRAIDEATQDDLDRGVIAAWHDESQLNRYLLDNPPAVVLPKTYLWSESWMTRKSRKFAICGTRDKGRYGGYAWIRGETDKKRLSKKVRRRIRYAVIAGSVILVALLVWLIYYSACSC